MFILATALDPNQTLAAGVAVVVAVISLLGVMVGQNRRLKVVDRKTDQLVANGGDSVRDHVYATATEVERIANVQQKVVENQANMHETINQILANQTQGFTQGLAAIQELGAVKQAQVAADIRLANFERHTTEQFATVGARIDALAHELVRMTMSNTGPIPVISSEETHA